MAGKKEITVQTDLRFSHGGPSFHVVGPAVDKPGWWRVRVTNPGGGFRKRNTSQPVDPNFGIREMEEFKILELALLAATHLAAKDIGSKRGGNYKRPGVAVRTGNSCPDPDTFRKKLLAMRSGAGA